MEVIVLLSWYPGYKVAGKDSGLLRREQEAWGWSGVITTLSLRGWGGVRGTCWPGHSWSHSRWSAH